MLDTRERLFELALGRRAVRVRCVRVIREPVVEIACIVDPVAVVPHKRDEREGGPLVTFARLRADVRVQQRRSKRCVSGQRRRPRAPHRAVCRWPGMRSFADAAPGVAALSPTARPHPERALDPRLALHAWPRLREAAAGSVGHVPRRRNPASLHRDLLRQRHRRESSAVTAQRSSR